MKSSTVLQKLHKTHVTLPAKVRYLVIGFIEVNEHHLMLKFQVGPNKNTLFPDTPFWYDHSWSHVELLKFLFRMTIHDAPMYVKCIAKIVITNYFISFVVKIGLFLTFLNRS